jgi:hypothetical protein
VKRSTSSISSTGVSRGTTAGFLILAQGRVDVEKIK